MSKCAKILSCCFVLVFLLITDVRAMDTTESADALYDTQSLENSLNLSAMYDALPEEAYEILETMGIKDIDALTLSEISATSVLQGIVKVAKSQSKASFATLPVLVSVLLLYALFDGIGQNFVNTGTKEVLSVVSALCISCALAIPVTQIIETAAGTITVASDFLLAYIPVMVAVLISCGKSISGAGYYSLMVAVAQGISQLSAKVLTPMLNVFLGVSFCCAVAPSVHIDGLTESFSKLIKWMLSFSFTIFSALLTFRTLISTSIDNVSTRAVKYTMSSFIPVVGAALSEAYKTVQGSITILKNGIGVFVIFAVSAVFLPVIVKLLMWLFAISLSKTVAKVLNLSVPLSMLSGVSTVLSVLFAIIICIMALFIISTALIITVGGNGI